MDRALSLAQGFAGVAPLGSW